MKKISDIYETHDYGQFKFMPNNRSVEPARIKKIRKSIEEIGYMYGEPILVNEDMEIINGQGRFVVCKDLNLPIYFTIQRGAGIKECIAMNISGTAWKTEDYIHSYAADGDEDYIFLEKKMKEFPGISLRGIASACIDSESDNTLRVIREGRFTLKGKDKTEINQVLNFLSGFNQLKELPHRDRMIAALVWVYRHSGADLNRVYDVFGNLVLNAKINHLSPGNIKAALQMIEDAYNNHLGASKRIRFVVKYEDYQSGKHTWYGERWAKSSERREANV